MAFCPLSLSLTHSLFLSLSLSLSHTHTHTLTHSLTHSLTVSLCMWCAGWLEVVLDRRLVQDDERGLGQGVKDNKLTAANFHILLETRSQPLTEVAMVTWPTTMPLFLPLELPSAGLPLPPGNCCHGYTSPSTTHLICCLKI